MSELMVAAISLGCSKNRVDTELILGAIENAKMTDNVQEADVIIVNTCGFIEAAKSESIETILEMAELKKEDAALIVCGCLTERYKGELEQELPEVDAFMGIHAYNDIGEAIRSALAKKRYSSYTENEEADFLSRKVTTPPHMAYVRIADGCDNFCSYCAIPYIRGGFRSRTMEDILAETEMLVRNGAEEIIFVAQDTTRYGEDLYGTAKLAPLMKKAAEIPGLRWLRVLYCYPESITQELIDTIAGTENIVNYIDMPIQHTSDPILSEMNRRAFAYTEKAIDMIRKTGKEFVIRTTVMTGFPGETEEDFEKLKKDVQEIGFDRLGVFAYSAEDGTPAAEMKNQIDEEIKQARADEIMQIQSRISERKGQETIGRRYTAVVEAKVDGGYEARTEYQVPDVDGILYIKTDRELMIGSFVQVDIVDADEYDLYGELYENS